MISWLKDFVVEHHPNIDGNISNPQDTNCLITQKETEERKIYIDLKFLRQHFVKPVGLVT